MLFHEIYGKYYSCVAGILKAAGEKPLTRAELNRIVNREAFGESGMVIPDALMSGQWPLLMDMTSVLEEVPSMPLTILQKRWLKTLLLDPRAKLFDLTDTGLEDVEPLYDPKVFVYFDRYSDGDPYEDAAYVQNFRTVLQGVRENREIEVFYGNQQARDRQCICTPFRIEYSEKDDKFRLLAWVDGRPTTLNLGRIQSCRLLGPAPEQKPLWQETDRMRTLILELSDWRNTLERAMLHFSHLEKTAEKLDEKHYRLTLRYDPQDETELLIRVLSFGPTVTVVSPESFRDQMRRRIEKQMNLRTQE